MDGYFHSAINITANITKHSKAGNISLFEKLLDILFGHQGRVLGCPVDAIGQDGNFSEEALKDRLNNELANGLGNLVNRTVVLIEKGLGGKIPKAKTDSALQKKLNLEKIKKQ